MFSRGTQAIDTVFRLDEEAMAAQDELVAQRIADMSTRRNVIVASVNAIAIAVLFVFLVFYQSVREMVYALDGVSRRMASGDMSEVNLPSSHDELGEVVRSFNSVAIELRKATMAAEASNHAKGEFLANMSHELRTPLNGVIGMAELLINSKLVGRQQEFAMTIRRSAESLLTILNDILDLSKIEALASLHWRAFHSICKMLLRKWVC